MPFNGNGSKRDVMRHSRVVFRREGKNVQYTEDIMSEGREAGLKYSSREQPCKVAKTWQTECSAEQTYRQIKTMLLGQKIKEIDHFLPVIDNGWT